jgi:hypothetical protein
MASTHRPQGKELASSEELSFLTKYFNSEPNHKLKKKKKKMLPICFMKPSALVLSTKA